MKPSHGTNRLATAAAFALLLGFTLPAWAATDQAGERDAAAYPATQSDETFERQLEQVEASFPLVANAFDYLKRLRYCTLDRECFDVIQQTCLDQRLPPKFCREQARDVCCQPPILQVAAARTVGPASEVSRLAIAADNMAELITCTGCVCTDKGCVCASCTITTK